MPIVDGVVAFNSAKIKVNNPYISQLKTPALFKALLGKNPIAWAMTPKTKHKTFELITPLSKFPTQKLKTAIAATLAMIKAGVSYFSPKLK